MDDEFFLHRDVLAQLVQELKLQDSIRTDWKKHYKEKPKDLEPPTVQEPPKCLMLPS